MPPGKRATGNVRTSDAFFFGDLGGWIERFLLNADLSMIALFIHFFVVGAMIILQPKIQPKTTKNEVYTVYYTIKGFTIRSACFFFL